MTRPWLIWLISLFCAAGIFGAMAVITHRSMALEQEGAQARADAELQERLRLALWRMETEASALMIEENNRPPEEFHPSTTGRPSPLTGPLPRHVRLHFDIRADGVIVSPEVPKSGDSQYQVAEENLRQLRALLQRSPSLGWCSNVVQSAPTKSEALWDNQVFLDAASKNKGPFDSPVVGNQNEPSNDQSLNALAQQGGFAQQGTLIQTPAAEAMKQQVFNSNEMKSRGQIYTKSAEGKNFLPNVTATTSSSLAKVKTDAKPGPAAKPSARSSSTTPPVDSQGTVVQAQRGASPPPAPAGNQTLSVGQRADDSAQQTGQLELGKASAPAENPQPSAQQRVTSFRPFWLENELFLVREVAEAGGRHVQGVWLDAASLKASLLEAVADILPQAGLQALTTIAFVPVPSGKLLPAPAPSAGAGDPMALIGLPWKLMPGERPHAVFAGWTPMRLTLAAAWLGALLAVLAAAGLLFGVTRLSERRAAFVSSVTHELRTPLTTFRLYSELLEQGMVREESDRTQYLHTLRMEAERLTHLVDNVLAYSRIERTNRRSRMERVELVPWFGRVRARLEDRAREAGMTLDAHVPESDNELACVTDATALEQIVFNLVDNACKYAAGRCAEPVVRVSLERRGRWADLRVCDSGPGIPRTERSRLFRPFHKSADEAANSKPGVGLGLALCHRLAGALGGKLALEKPADKSSGACFVLRLPAA
jgi:signal transduction histidine kinase